MHELAITQKLVNLVISECKKKKIENPKKAIVELGSLTSYEVEPLLLYFGLLKKENNLLMNTQLEVTKIDGKILCNNCNKRSHISEKYLIICPFCKSVDVEISEGKDLKLKEIEV